MKRFLSFVGGNVGSLLLAVILAIAVWMNAVYQEDPDEVRELPFTVPVTAVHLSPELVAQGYQEAIVQLTLRAPRSTWDQLLPGDVHLTADLQGKIEGAYDILLQVTIDRSPVRLEIISPSALHITIDRLLVRQMEVRVELSGNPAPGFQTGVPTMVPDAVELAGPAALVDRVASVVAPISIEGLRNAIDQNVSLLALDTGGNTVTGVTIDPDAISVALPMQQLGGYRDLVVKPDITGSVQTGYRLTGLTVTPLVVTLYSDDPDVIRGLPGYVLTQPLDIGGAQEDMTRSLSLILPASVQVVGDPKILVQVSVSAIEDSITITRPVRVQGLEPGLSATPSPSLVDVFLSGPVPALRNLLLRPADIDVYLDLTGLAAGTYKLQPTVRIVNAQLRLFTTSPEQIEVTILPESTPSP
jgi:YbbR domain-containing protein